MKLSSRSIPASGRIAGRCAFAVQSPSGHIRLSGNRNPQLSWAGVPAGTRSFALSCIDQDAPTRPDDVNREGRSVPASLPRAEFVHWLMVGIPAAQRTIEEGACSAGVIAHGKTAPQGPEGSVQGLNDYTGWFDGDAAMAGRYLGYDGPCPPWNDERVHRYRFEIHATDIERWSLDSGFSVAQFRAALQGHVLASASLTGVYSLNPLIRLP